MKVFDLHCDTLSELRYAEEAGQPKSFAENDLQIDLKKLQKGDYMLQCFAAFVNLARPGQDPLVAALEEIDIFKRIMAKYSDFIAPVYQPEDLRKNAEAGKISGVKAQIQKAYEILHREAEEQEKDKRELVALKYQLEDAKKKAKKVKDGEAETAKAPEESEATDG